MENTFLLILKDIGVTFLFTGILSIISMPIPYTIMYFADKDFDGGGFGIVGFLVANKLKNFAKKNTQKKHKNCTEVAIGGV